MMRKTSGLFAILVLVAALAAPVAAQQNLYKQDIVSADSGLFRYLFSSHTVSAEGGIGVPCINMSASANTKYSLVGYDSTPITVVTRVRKDNVDVSAVTVADSLHSVVLDTLPLNGASTTQYDVNKIASFKLRVRFTAADATNDTWAIYVYGKDQSGIGTKTTLKKKTTATLDTVTDNYFSYIDSIRVTTKATGDSVAVWAYPNGIGVVTGTGYTATLGPEGAVGIAQTAMAGRTRGLVVFNGPSPVLVNGTTSTVVPGYWLVPAGVAGKCSTAQTKPDVAIGRVNGYLTADGTVDAFIFPMMQNAAPASESATVAALAYGLAGANGGTITNPHADTLKATETNIVLAGIVIPNSLTFPNGTTVANGHADTVTITEGNVKIAGAELLTGTLTMGNGATVANGHADTATITETNVKVAGILIPNSVTLANGTTIDDVHADTTTITETNAKVAGKLIVTGAAAITGNVSGAKGTFTDSVIGTVHKATSITFDNGTTVANGHADTVTVTEAKIKLVGDVIPSSILLASGATIDDPHADTLTLTETNIKLAGVVVPNSITFANGTTIDDGHADTTTITETNVKVAGILIPNSITMGNGTTIDDGHADTTTVTEANIKLAGVVIPNSVTFANGTTIDDGHADTTTITETNVKVAGILIPNSITFPNGTTVVNGHEDTVTIALPVNFDTASVTVTVSS